jgi:amino acid adenylation domain-containing protein
LDLNELPLSHGQRALWFLQRLRPDAAAWNIAAAARVRGRLDFDRLRRAFERLTERHDALRLSFHPTADGPVQRLHSESRLDFREGGCLQEEAERPFDLEQDPLLRVRLLRTDGDDILLLVIHHLVADLGSLAVIVRELGPLYEGAALDPPASYAAFMVRERERLEGRAAERHWEHWQKRLSGELPVCELPTDRPRPATRTFRGGTRTRRVKLPASRTLFPFLVAGLDVLLHRASGQTDLLVGSPTSGRLAPELDGTVGYLVNPVVLRSDLSGSPTFSQLLERVRSVAMGALRHQEYPFPLIVERLQPERDPARPPVFQVMLSFQKAHLEGTGDLAAFALGIEGAVVRTGSLVFESLPLERRSSQLDLELMAAETSRGLELALTFNADLFEPATAERFLGHLETLLEAAARDPERRIGELPLLSAAEHQQLVEWNSTALPLPDRSVPELFEEQAARTPDAVAVNGMTYRELSERSNAVAQSLSDLSPEEPVGVRMERGAGLAVALLGILKAGGVYLPLNPSHPEARLSRMLELSGARWILNVGAGLAPAREGVNPSPTSLAYLLFTSGSTGDPKGALVPHRGLLNHLLSKIRGLGLSPSDRVAQTAPQSFDIHIWQLLAPLLAGARVEILPDEIVRDPSRLLAEIDERGITVLQVVPSLLAPLLDEVERGGGEGLRILVTIGEALPPELARRWLAARPTVPLVNNYGPTECADGVSDAWLLSVPEGETHTSIGRPIPNMRLHVLSPDLEQQPIGFPGEVCIAGAGVGRGYLGDPARTAAAFIPEPGGGRLYRTGDLGRRRPNGELEILGRLDHQIKHRGVRVEPGEIEAALVTHPGVREAVVAIREGRLVAWWTGDPDASPELRDHLRQRLPEAMVPLLFQRLDALPLTPHGKLDRRALPDPAQSAPAASPGDEMEQLLAGIFGTVLGRDSVGPRDDFFALGGHSLLATQVAARVREALGIEPPLSLLFEEPTVAGLAGRLRTQAGLSSTPVRRASRPGRIPLSFAQQRLWFLHRLDPESPAYNMPGLLRLSGPVDLSKVVERHEALRTTFPMADGEPYQEIGPAVLSVPVVDLSALPEPEQEARRLAFEEGRRPFDLARGPLLRALLLKLGEEQRLVAVLHHIVADGWSLEVLAREVRESLPELPVQYADFAVWQREQPPASLDWWRRELAGELSPLELPLDRPRPARPRQRGARLPVLIPEETVRPLRQLARAAGVTPFMVLLAAWQALLHRLSGQEDIRVGSPVANRRQVELEGLIGCFANPLVLRTRFGQPRGFRELVQLVRGTALGAYTHQDVPFELLVNELQPERDPSRTPLFQALLVFQPGASSLEGVEEIDNGTSKLDLALSLREAGDRIEGWIEYDTDLFDGSTVERWLSSLLAHLEAGIADPYLLEMPLLRKRQQRQVERPSIPDAPPAGPVETAIAEIWTQVLGTRPESRHRSFFDMGGHSLLGVKVMARLNEAFGTDLPLRALFEAPTVAELARQVDSGTGRIFPELRRGGPPVLSFAQERLWVMDRLTPNLPVYNLFQAFDLKAPDLEALERALAGVVDRHEALRTRFETVQGKPVPVVEPCRLPVLGFGEEDCRPFDLGRGPLFRFLLSGNRLQIAIHHIVCDEGSAAILIQEVGALYRGETLDPLPFQYADYADWQRRWPPLDDELAWWTDRLAGLAPLELPTDRPRPAAQSFRGSLVTAELPALPHDRRATPFMQMLAVWQILLYRLTGQTDIAVGSPAANRSRPELEGIVGLFVNNLVLRVDLSGEPTFAEAMERVRETALSAYAHQDLPFERLANPVFQAAFSLEEPLPSFELGEPVDVHTGTSKFDLWLQVRDGRARAEYATDLFDAATVHRWLGHLRVLMKGITPGVRISELPLMSPQEMAELVSWNSTEAEIPAEPVHRLFLRQAERAPDALAISWPGGRLNYGELARRASWMAAVEPETVVALRMERSPELIIGIVGTLLAGGAWLPIDPANPEERARWILEDSKAILPEGEGRPNTAAFDPDLLAYVIYTSGSTGTPKGTEISHRSLSSFIAWHCRARGLTPADRTTLIAGPGFDASVLEIWAALTSGASLHIPPPDAVLSPSALLAWMAEQRITVSCLPTPLAEAVLAEPMPEGLALRTLYTGGDRLRVRPAPGLPFELINYYGPTEVTISATTGRVSPTGDRLPEIGSPVANTEVHVLDRSFRLVPTGVVGELCVAGVGLARGYRGRPDLTAERFLPNPFGDGERIYRTGDLARWLPDGNLQFLGRIDHQVKIRGLRVELGEIEAALRQCPGVREAAVVMREDRRLTGYYVADREQKDLRERLRGKLPEVMVPAVFVRLDALPLTPNGKIDRRALPAPITQPAVGPRTPLEVLVAGVCGEVLGVEAVPRDVSFFDLGGNSLMATQVVTLIQDVLPVQLDLRKVFEGPTVARMAALLEEERISLPEPEQLAMEEILAELLIQTQRD